MAGKIKKGDTVRVITGKDKMREGKVLAVKGETVIVEGVNMVSKHTKPGAGNPNGGIISKESPIHISNVMLLDNGQVARVGYRLEDGKKVRYNKKTGAVIDKVTTASK